MCRDIKHDVIFYNIILFDKFDVFSNFPLFFEFKFIQTIFFYFPIRVVITLTLCLNPTCAVCLMCTSCTLTIPSRAYIVFQVRIV